MKLKQLLASLLCLALLLCCAPIALAAEDTATVTFWFANGSEIKTAFDLTVTDGTAESFGYTVSAADHNGQPIETVTAMDVLVAAHAAIYGDAFTKETAGDYLIVNTGFITKAFGLATSNLGFTINDATPHDNTYVEAYGGYTGYAIDTARVQDGDRVSLYVYKDAYWSDILPRFDKTSIETAPEQSFTLSVSGYVIMYYGCSKQETIDKNTKPLEGVTVECTQDFKTFTSVGTLDESGKLSVTMPQTGTYYLVVRGMFDDPDLDEVPLVANICKVIVKEPEPQKVDPTLTLVCAPAKTTYVAGETLDAAGLTLLYTDEYGKEQTVTEGFACDPQTLSAIGTQTVTVTYKDLSVTFDVTVEPDTSNAKYFPIGVRPVFRIADHALTLGLTVKFRDLRKTAPDKTETYAFTLSLRFLLQLFKK